MFHKCKLFLNEILFNTVSREKKRRTKQEKLPVAFLENKNDFHNSIVVENYSNLARLHSSFHIKAGQLIQVLKLLVF